jgi:hypothetical protein
MADIVTNDDFVNACNHLIATNQLSIQGERFVDPFARKVWDERGDGIENLIDITPDTVILEAALDGANAALAIEQQLQSAAAVAISQGKDYLKRQLLNPAPDVQAIFNTLSGAINNNPYLLQMFTNQRNLTLAANGWQALDTATPLGRVRYILIAEQVIALLG